MRRSSHRRASGPYQLYGRSGADTVLPPTAKTVPTPFQFEIEEISLRLRDRVVVQEQYQKQNRLLPIVDLGKVDPSSIRNGTLLVNQDATTNIWLGPGGTFGHRLHHHDVYVALLTMPIDARGTTTFLAGESFPIDFMVRLRAPRFLGFEKLKVGLLDTESFKNVASMAIGRIPTPFPVPPFGGGGGGGSKTINILDLVSNPGIALVRVEEPDILGEIVLDHTEIAPLQSTQSVEMRLMIGADGAISGAARIGAGGAVSNDVKLAPRANQEPREFFVSRSTLAKNTRLSATLYIETLPSPQVFRVEPNVVSAAARAGEPVSFRIEGIGFGPDTRVQMVPENEAGAAEVAPTGLSLQRQTGGARRCCAAGQRRTSQCEAGDLLVACDVERPQQYAAGSRQG